MANSNDVLQAIQELKTRLYGENGFEGDIPEMKACLKQIPKNTEAIHLLELEVHGKTGGNGLVGRVRELTNRQWRMWTLLLIVAGGSGGIGAGIAKLFG